MHFDMKNYLKSNRNHIAKYIIIPYLTFKIYKRL
jgi:hypothetical protein